VELGTREQRALVRELALSSDVIAVDKVAYNTEMFASRRRSISWEKSQTFLAEDIVTLDLELTVILLSTCHITCYLLTEKCKNIETPSVISQFT
jgi:hypothetical protein